MKKLVVILLTLITACLFVFLMYRIFYLDFDMATRTKTNVMQKEKQIEERLLQHPIFPSSRAEPFDLTETETEALVNKSKSDNGESAYRLFQYYYYHLDRETKALEWLHEAVKREHLTALFRLGIIYEGKGERAQAEKYLKWAANRGSLDAIQALKRFERSE